MSIETPNGLKVGDKVTQVDIEGIKGIIKDIRYEVTSKADPKEREKSILVSVQWDNGTYSYFAPEKLKQAQ